MLVQLRGPRIGPNLPARGPKVVPVRLPDWRRSARSDLVRRLETAQAAGPAGVARASGVAGSSAPTVTTPRVSGSRGELSWHTFGGDRRMVASDDLDGDTEPGQAGQGRGRVGLGRVQEHQQASQAQGGLVGRGESGEARGGSVATATTLLPAANSAASAAVAVAGTSTQRSRTASGTPLVASVRSPCRTHPQAGRLAASYRGSITPVG